MTPPPLPRRRFGGLFLRAWSYLSQYLHGVPGFPERQETNVITHVSGVPELLVPVGQTGQFRRQVLCETAQTADDVPDQRDVEALPLSLLARRFRYETDPTVVNSRQVFVPSESPGSFFSTFVAHVDGRAEDHLAEIRDAIQSVDRQVPVFGVKTMQQRLDEVFARLRFYRTSVWILAGFAFVLVLIGIYGIVSYTVVQRTREIVFGWPWALRPSSPLPVSIHSCIMLGTQNSGVNMLSVPVNPGGATPIAVKL